MHRRSPLDGVGGDGRGDDVDAGGLHPRTLTPFYAVDLGTRHDENSVPTGREFVRKRSWASSTLHTVPPERRTTLLPCWTTATGPAVVRAGNGNCA
jgi:hypothetical protein